MQVVGLIVITMPVLRATHILIMTNLKILMEDILQLK